MGSIILPKEIDKIEEWVNDAIDDGAKLLYGVKRISVSCYKPSVLFNPTANVCVSTQEIFGSVLCIYSFSDRNMAIEIANSLTVHFQASVFTKDIDVAFDTANKLEVTVVMVNDHTAFGVD